ncbi:hypothetical protein KY290_003538 [Solanum tuberosum]|uniref:Pollen-specific leucine-rich repeat extensin-like protein 2 n=2 Tax=Solanum tuberosum TaxID=4113 RepID=A0ABQ7WT87_SOLTU|nr:hypothetical protein KY289_003878 [Solanum tuberosum]KAH0767653.1 hypothetical protein KY285_003524 [Solanum tuberosum]KAH0783940.1 hypothetical protein KY290_003538 [Solanum tuberosum]
MENVKGARQHSDSYLSASSSSDSSVELSTHPKESVYTKPEQDDAFVSATPAALSSPDVSSQAPQWSMISSSPREETGNPLFPQNVEAMKSPPSMDHPPGYDPNRIPKSIFSSKPTTTDWSTASNESLFSIQMGANSFSTDYSNYMLPKSGEVPPEEWKNSTANPYYTSEIKSNENKSLSSPPLRPLMEDNDGKSTRPSELGLGIQEKNLKEEKTVNNIIQKTPINIDIEEPTSTTFNKPDDRVIPPIEETHISSPVHASSPCYSEASGNSSKSFVFPVLVNDGGKSNSLKSASEKVEKSKSQPQAEFQPDIQQLQKPSESQPKVAEKSWCSCFTCWPRCC